MRNNQVSATLSTTLNPRYMQQSSETFMNDGCRHIKYKNKENVSDTNSVISFISSFSIDNLLSI